MSHFKNAIKVYFALIKMGIIFKLKFRGSENSAILQISFNL